MCRALPGSEYYDGSAPYRDLRSATDLSTHGHLADDRSGTIRGGFPRSLMFDQRARRPALPLRPRRGYAVDLHHDLPPEPVLPGQGVTRHHDRVGHGRRQRARTATQPTSAGLELVRNQEASTPVSLRTPSRLAHRARPIRQYWTDPTSSRLLPPIPSVPRDRLPPASPHRYDGKATRPLTSVRTISASWRTTGFLTDPLSGGHRVSVDRRR